MVEWQETVYRHLPVSCFLKLAREREADTSPRACCQLLSGISWSPDGCGGTRSLSVLSAIASGYASNLYKNKNEMCNKQEQ